MKERQILFSGPMVRAILEGRKTMTRRIVKPQPKIVHAQHDDASITTERIFRAGDKRIHCPYGRAGDRLWVRETWRTHSTKHDAMKPSELLQGDAVIHYDASMKFIAPFLGKTRASIHMPRWASRITLEITDVRVDRLQDISYEDAISEGMPDLAASWLSYQDDKSTSETMEQSARRLKWPQRWFRQVWESLRGTSSWTENPWVWVVSFRRLL